MFLFKTSSGLRDHLGQYKGRQRIAFVPTLGALHDGHMHLMKRAREEADIVVCSIFVNPTQFNQASDLEKYPRTIDRDLPLLAGQKVDVLYWPRDGEVYPSELDTTVDIDLEGLGRVLEGAFRPGHFQGVMQVVKRLLEIVEPDVLVMGKKDFQQLAVVRRMLQQLDWNEKVDLLGVDTVRAHNGLALSSRNMRLSDKGRQQGGTIYATLNWIKKNFSSDMAMDRILSEARAKLVEGGFDVEYLSIVDGYRLEPILSKTESTYPVVLTAAWLEGVRLIDNLEL